MTHLPSPKLIKALTLELTISDILPNEVYCLIQLQNNQIATGGCCYSISIFDINITTKQYILILEIKNAHNDSITSLCELLPNKLISSSNDTSIKIWSISSTSYHLLKTITSHSMSVSSIILLRNNLFASSSWDSTINIYDCDSYNVITSLHEDNWIHSILQLQSKDLIIASCSTPSICCWHCISYQKESVFEGFYACWSSHITEVCKGKIALSSNGDQKPIVIINVDEYVIEKVINIEGGFVSESSLCVVDEFMFIYVYDRKVVQISSVDWEVLCCLDFDYGLRGYSGQIAIQKGKYLVVDNHFNRVSLVKMEY